MVARNKYRRLNVSTREAAGDGYKRHLGGGEQDWETRGAFQLALLRHLGLQPDSRLVDYGCGPIRAGQHLIRFLDPCCYRGFDFNAGFIAIARDIVNGSPELRDKRPELVHSDAFLEIQGPVDFVLLFSVLNHCSPEERLRALEFVRTAAPGTRVCVSHAAWFFALDPRHREGLEVLHLDMDTLPPALDPVRWGWKEHERNKVLPVALLSPEA